MSWRSAIADLMQSHAELSLIQGLRTGELDDTVYDRWVPQMHAAVHVIQTRALAIDPLPVWFPIVDHQVTPLRQATEAMRRTSETPWLATALLSTSLLRHQDQPAFALGALAVVIRWRRQVPEPPSAWRHHQTQNRGRHAEAVSWMSPDHDALNADADQVQTIINQAPRNATFRRLLVEGARVWLSTAIDIADTAVLVTRSRRGRNAARFGASPLVPPTQPPSPPPDGPPSTRPPPDFSV